MPANAAAAQGLRYFGGGGICRGILFTLTGCKTAPCLFPKRAPKKVNGAEMANHIRTIVSIVPKGTAPEDPAITRKRFRRKKTAKTSAGKRNAVRNVTLAGRSPPSEAYSRLETYPPTLPNSVQKNSITAANEPRFEGDKKTKSANIRVTPIMIVN